MLSLKYSDSGNPYIDCNKYGQLIFSTLTADKQKGYKYMAYVNRYVENTIIKKAGKRQTNKELEFNSYVFNMHFKRDAAGKKGVPNKTIPRKIVTRLSRIISSLLIEDTYLPYKNFKMLDKLISEVDWQKIADSYKPRKKKKKKYLGASI